MSMLTFYINRAGEPAEAAAGAAEAAKDELRALASGRRPSVSGVKTSAVSRIVDRFEDLVAHWTANDELVVGVALARRGVDDPVGAMHEAQVFPQVVTELSEAAERHEMPETAATPVLEQSLAHHARDRAVRRSIIREL
jgi:hypothetical protein